MKKLLPVLLLLVIAAGCNKEKIITDNLNGEWEVYKYLLYNVDRTNLYNTQYPGYRITFSGTSFTETYGSVDTTSNDTTTITGTYAFADNDEKLVFTHINYSYTPILDTAGNVIDSTEIPTTVEREYTIFNSTKDHIQLRNDSSQLYMRKLEL